MFTLYFKPSSLTFLNKCYNKNAFFKRNHGSSFFAEKLEKRGLVRISGESTSDFLQGLVTNDMRYLDNGKSSLYCMFLNNKGRVLFDSIIYKTEEKHTFYLECDKNSAPQLIKHLSSYRLRKKINISSADNELSAWVVYNPGLIDRYTLNQDKSLETDEPSFNAKTVTNEQAIIVPDPRIPALGHRVIIKNSDEITCVPRSNLYDICRFKLGIAECTDELLLGQSFPLEMNCDYLNGVSFDKGCYIGQELTARTFHTGVVRKRLMPIIFEEEPIIIPSNTSIDDPDIPRKSPIGKVRAVKGKYGIGLMRVVETLGAKSLKMLEYTGRSYSPFWWPDTVQKKSVSLT